MHLCPQGQTVYLHLVSQMTRKKNRLVKRCFCITVAKCGLLFCFYQLRTDKGRKAALSRWSHEKENGEEKTPLRLAPGFLRLQSCTHNWFKLRAIISHLQSNVSLKTEACADVSAFLSRLFALCVFCILWKVPQLKVTQWVKKVSLGQSDSR